jgi:hypothetical protein
VGGLAVAAVLLSGAELALTVGVVRGLALAPVLGLHLAIVALSGVWLLASPRRTMRYGLLLWIATAAFGPLGGPGVLFAMLSERRHARHAVSIDEWHRTLFPPSESDGQADLWRRIGQRAHDRPSGQDVTPFIDVLTLGSVPERQAAIAIIAQQFDPAFAPALRAALRDEHNVIRVQAATAIARLEQEFFERTVALEAAVAHAPDDPDARLALASHYDHQAFAGLFDPTREESCRVKAAECYARYLDRRPDDQATDFRLARQLLRRGLVGEAEPRFRRLAEAGYPAARFWLMECLFTGRRFAELRAVAGDWTDHDERDTPPDVEATVALWSGRQEAA